MPRLDTVLVLLLAMPALAFANSNPVRSTLERTWAERDARELSEFEQLTASLKDAWQGRDVEHYSDVNESLLRAMDREIDQAKVKVDRAARAATLSRREPMQAATGGASDMLRSIEDPHRDGDTPMVRHHDLVRIGTMAGALQNSINRGDTTAMKRNLSLTEEFLSVMRRDVAATGTDRR